ncbi:2TM domain-containing protein [Tenacibaculum sp. MAR_2010_89]|uniref:XRE family transcriptional regulator n=1 Tax=Tenacibaculum sp. MAR_2010_89 TaxID=1250198 RepID=UPI00089C9BD0|nr:XRE family transcriptional regulator [Tenacibaculum sp. MAR_2010_89]SEE61427.1 2TM domain-containing protein [Tenacibaculum sp. MAR_2010_89]
MEYEAINLKDIKKMRLERHWSQDQLAEMSGLSKRTIQRIESGENAGLESIKSLAAVFEINITNSNKKIEQIKLEEEYIQKVKGFYKLFFISLLSLVLPFIIAINDSSNWPLFLWILASWLIVLGIYSLNSFDFFGEEWKKKIISKKFNKNQ